MNLVVFLQNAWSPTYAGRIWPRSSWLRALARSRSGVRLKVMIDDLSVCENTTPSVGATPKTILPPDEHHILSVLQERQAQVVVACGAQAGTALLALWNGPLLVVPHPAFRLLTDELYRQARTILEKGLAERLRMEQHLHGIAIKKLGR